MSSVKERHCRRQITLDGLGHLAFKVADILSVFSRLHSLCQLLQPLLVTFPLSFDRLDLGGRQQWQRTSGVLPGSGPGMIRVLKKIPASA